MTESRIDYIALCRAAADKWIDHDGFASLADALIALDTAVQGCGIQLFQAWEHAIGGFVLTHCGQGYWCAACHTNKESTIRTLLGRAE